MRVGIQSVLIVSDKCRQTVAATNVACQLGSGCGDDVLKDLAETGRGGDLVVRADAKRAYTQPATAPERAHLGGRREEQDDGWTAVGVLRVGGHRQRSAACR